MKLLILSHFDFLYGPRIILKAPDSVDDTDLKKIPILMDLYEKGFFVHIFGKFKSANCIFEIESKYARGKKEVLLLSFLVDINNDINLELAKELLTQFSTEIKKIKDIYKAFYTKSEIHEGDEVKLKNLEILFQNFYESFPVENIIIKRKPAKIFVFGLHEAGKTTIIEQLRHSVNKTILPTTNVSISRVNLNDLSILIYDCPGQTKFHDLWMPYLKHQNGLVFVLDIHDTEKFSDAKRVFHEIINHSEVNQLPLLILFNKVDLKEGNSKLLTTELEIEKSSNRPLKYFFTSGLKNIGIEDAFKWISKEVSKNLVDIPKRDLGLIFTKWDETIGTQVISVYPREVFQDPETIAIKCFSISQFIFGGKEFKRTSVILPFTHIRANAAIYFDFISSPSVRGGRLPFALILFFDESIPRTVINHLKFFIFNEFEQLKADYLNKHEIQITLEQIYKNVLDKLDSIKSTVNALRLAEIKYRTLFKSARDAIIIIDKRSGIVVDANEQAEILLGTFSEDLIGIHGSLIRLNNSENFLKKILAQLKMEDAPPIELEVINTAGKKIPVEANASYIQMGGQNMIQCILRDITVRKNTEIKLKNSEKKFRHLFEKSPFSIILINQKGIIIDLNPAVVKLLGFNRNELIGENYTQLPIIKKQDLKYITSHIKRIMNGKETKPIRIQIARKDNKKVWIEFHSSIIMIDQINYLQLIAHNITEQKEAEEIIQKRLKFEKLVSDLSSRFVVIRNLDKVINETLEEIGKFSKADRSSLILIDNENVFMRNTHEWCAQGIKSEKESFQFILMDNFPWWIKKLHENEYIHISDVSKLSDKAKAIKDLLMSQNVSSLLTYSIYIKEKLSGYISLEKRGKLDSWMWNEESFALLGMVSEFLGNELSRVRAEKVLKISRGRFHQAYDKANFYKELFAFDMNHILENIKSAISIYQKLNKQNIENLENKFAEIQNLLNIIKNQAKGGMSLISNIQKLSQIEESKLIAKPIKLNEILKEAFFKLKNEFPEKELKVELKPKNKDFYVFGNEILETVFQNIMQIDIKNNPNSKVNLTIQISNEDLKDQKYINIQIIDEKGNFDNNVEDESEKDNQGMLIRLTLIDKIIMSFKGTFWVENNNFVVSLPAI
ncbi:MAG: PAS domain S-box protein [Candidatus Lokiarchaeota archaeon]